MERRSAEIIVAREYCVTYAILFRYDKLVLTRAHHQISSILHFSSTITQESAKKFLVLVWKQTNLKFLITLKFGVSKHLSLNNYKYSRLEFMYYSHNIFHLQSDSVLSSKLGKQGSGQKKSWFLCPEPEFQA